MGTTVLDVRDAAHPRIVDQWPAPPGTHTHKVQVADDLTDGRGLEEAVPGEPGGVEEVRGRGGPADERVVLGWR